MEKQVDEGERSEGKERMQGQLGRWRSEELSEQWRKRITRDQEKVVFGFLMSWWWGFGFVFITLRGLRL